MRIQKKIYPKIGDWEYIKGIPGGPYQIQEIDRINNRTFFLFNIGGIEHNAVIDLAHFQEHGNVVLIDAEFFG